MACAIALTFSKVVDPKNPLYLDDNSWETVDWEFGVLSAKEINVPSNGTVYKSKPKVSSREKKAKKSNMIFRVPKKKLEIKSLDHDQMSDPAMNEKFEEEECHEESMDVGAFSDSSLEPYNLSDDDTDLQKKFSHLSDLTAALRKPDDPDSCMAMHPEASALAPALLDMIRSRDVSHHAEAYVRRSVLFAASCILISLHPSFVASSLIEGNQDISTGLEWIRIWALQVAEADPDTECSSMAMTCLRLHSEMALQTSRALEAVDHSRAGSKSRPSKLDSIIIPFGNMMG